MKKLFLALKAIANDNVYRRETKRVLDKYILECLSYTKEMKECDIYELEKIVLEYIYSPKFMQECKEGIKRHGSLEIFFYDYVLHLLSQTDDKNPNHKTFHRCDAIAFAAIHREFNRTPHSQSREFYTAREKFYTIYTDD